MSPASDPLRRHHRGTPREVWFLAFGVAVLAHLLLFLFWPTQEIEPLEVRTPDRPLYLAVGTVEVVALGREGAEGVPPASDTTWMPPRMWNEAFLQPVLAREWPRDLWEWEEGGRATVRATVTSNGRVRGSSLMEGSGDPAMDRAFLVLADRMRFSPARLAGEFREVEVELSLFVSPPARALEQSPSEG